jgi:hypothetical protein
MSVDGLLAVRISKAARRIEDASNGLVYHDSTAPIVGLKHFARRAR